MPDLAYVLDKLKNSTWNYVNVSNPRNLLIDEKGHLVTLELYPPKLDRFDAQTLTLINCTSIAGLYARVVGCSKNYYFAGFSDGSIVVIDSGNLTTVNTIRSHNTESVSGIMFLNNGRTMVATGTSNRSLVFFNQSDHVPSNYTFTHLQTVSYSTIHGLTRYSDSHFFTTSWDNNSIYSYTATPNNPLWTEQFVADASSMSNGGSYMAVDECGRYWYSSLTSTIRIFNASGSLIGNFSLPNGSIFGIIMTDDYVLYLSDLDGNWQRILRIDPNIQC